jgi:hypothetical protein
MPRPKSKEWKSVGIEILRPKKVPSDFYEQLIAGHLGSSSQQRRDRITKKLESILGLYQAALYYRSRPTFGSKKDTLAKLVEALKSTQEQLSSLDDDTRGLLIAHADNAQPSGPNAFPFWQPPIEYDHPDQRGASQLFKDRHGAEYLGQALDYLAGLRQWSSAALNEITLKRSVTRTANVAERNAVRSLLNIWKKEVLTGTGSKRPTADQLQRFAAAALHPIRAQFKGMKHQNLKGIVAEVLAES